MSQPRFTTRPTYVIGLGGTGATVLRLLKMKYRLKFGDLPPTIRLLAIDTDPQKASAPGDELSTNEFLHTANFSGTDIVTNLADYPKIKNWWQYSKDAINPGFIDRGAGAKRPVGRLALFHRFSTVYGRLQRMIDEPFEYVNQREYPEQLKKSAAVYLVASLAGGTGTGMFLDIAHVVRSIVERRVSAYVNGLLVLPSAFSGEVDSATARRHAQNGYAALKELDFFQTRGVNDDVPFIDYPEVGRLAVKRRPYDWTYLIGNRGDEGVLFTKISQVFDRIAQFTFASIALEIGQNGESTLDNWKDANNPELRRYRGTHAVYSSIGAESLETPSFVEESWIAGIAADVARRSGGEKRPDGERAALEKKVDELMPLCARLYELRRLTTDKGQRATLFPQLGAELAGLGSPTKKEEALLGVDRLKRDLDVALSTLNVQPVTTGLKDALDAWIDDTAKKLIRSPEYSLAGAAQLLSVIRERLAAIFNAKAPQLPSFQQAREEIEKAKGGLFGGGAEKVAQAMDGARGWFEGHYDGQVLQRVVSAASAPVADGMALLDSWIAKLGEAQARLGDAGKALATEYGEKAQKQGLSAQQAVVSRDAADKVLKDHQPEIVAAAVKSLFLNGGEAIVKLVSERSGPEGWKALLLAQLKPAVAEARAKNLKRSPEIGDRIIRALGLCRPLVFYNREEHDKRLEGGRLTRVPAIWLVASDQGGRDIGLAEKLRAAGLDQEDEKHSKPQLLESADPDRDDIFIAQHGLFLDTIHEVTDAKAHYDELPSDLQAATCLFPQVKAVREHSFHAVDGNAIEQYFAAAVVTSALKQVGSALVFDKEIFGSERVIREGSDWKQRLDRARSEFERGDFARVMKGWVDAECGRAGSNDAFKSAMREKISAAKGKEWQPELTAEIHAMCESFERLLKRL